MQAWHLQTSFFGYRWVPWFRRLLRFRVPSAVFFSKVLGALTNLADLRISLTEMAEDGLLTLGQFPSLLRLQLLVSNKFVVTVQATSFPNLKELYFRKIEQAYVSFVKGSAPRLEEISNMPFSVSAAKANKFY